MSHQFPYHRVSVLANEPLDGVADVAGEFPNPALFKTNIEGLFRDP
jgi:hypothetical protein